MSLRAIPSSSAIVGKLAHFSPLSREAESELCQRWTANEDPKAAEALVKAHLRYVVATANKYRHYGIPVDELVAEGNFGVLHALRKFDPARGTRFVTYAAYWIRAYILNYVLRSWSMVSGGGGALRSKTFFRLRRERARVANLTSDPEQAQLELAKRLEVPLPRLRSMLQQLDNRDVSLDAQIFDDSGAALVERLAADQASQEEVLQKDQKQSQLEMDVRRAMSKLDVRERFIVERRLMADAEDALSLAEIGRQLGVSRERARQLEVRAKGKLKSQLQSGAAEPVQRCA